MVEPPCVCCGAEPYSFVLKFSFCKRCYAVAEDWLNFYMNHVLVPNIRIRVGAPDKMPETIMPVQPS